VRRWKEASLKRRTWQEAVVKKEALAGGVQFFSSKDFASSSLCCTAQSRALRKSSQLSVKLHSSALPSFTAISTDFAERNSAPVESGRTILTLSSRMSVHTPQSGSAAAAGASSLFGEVRMSGVAGKCFGRRRAVGVAKDYELRIVARRHLHLGAEIASVGIGKGHLADAGAGLLVGRRPLPIAEGLKREALGLLGRRLLLGRESWRDELNEA